MQPTFISDKESSGDDVPKPVQTKRSNRMKKENMTEEMKRKMAYYKLVYKNKGRKEGPAQDQ